MGHCYSLQESTLQLEKKVKLRAQKRPCQVTYLNLKRVAMDAHASINHAWAIRDKQSREHVKSIS
jgi:hypothetical protein